MRNGDLGHVLARKYMHKGCILYRVFVARNEELANSLDSYEYQSRWAREIHSDREKVPQRLKPVSSSALPQGLKACSARGNERVFSSHA
jgi:hypothetical protein